MCISYLVWFCSLLPIVIKRRFFETSSSLDCIELMEEFISVKENGVQCEKLDHSIKFHGRLGKMRSALV